LNESIALRVVAGARAAEAYLIREGYRGYDPYDALLSPLFRLPVLRSTVARRLAQQALRRLPVNVRPLLMIKKGYNPVTLALALQAYAYLSVADPPRAPLYRERAASCIAELELLRARGYSGSCWGYDFDWEALGASMPAGTPTIVATGFVTHALFTAHQLLRTERALSLLLNATEFVRRDVPRRIERSGCFSWSYSPVDRTAVVNATAQGARLCAEGYALTADPELLELATGGVTFVTQQQRANGSWPYAVGDRRTWADNFHTGYVLECVADYERHTGDSSFAGSLERGWRYYRDHFFTTDSIPKYRDDRAYPIDATAVAQSILTMCTFGDYATAERIALFALERMQRRDGAFIYQRNRLYSNRITYVRWSVAWMFCAFARLLCAESGQH